LDGDHAILSVALPAVLPPPMPLSPFVLAAGALKMSRNKFLVTFTVSRCLRHAAFAATRRLLWPHVLRMWNRFSRKYGARSSSSSGASSSSASAIAFWKLYKTSRSVSAHPSDSGAIIPPAEA
jgi:hypothetical protein